MKVEIKKLVKQKEIKYPCLMKGIVGGDIIYALTGNNTVFEGIVLNADSDSEDMYKGKYVTGLEIRVFKEFEGVIILSND